MQSNMLAAFYWGYVLLQIPGGRIAETFGGKWVYGIGILATSVFSVVSPLAAKWNYWAFVVVRFLEGNVHRVALIFIIRLLSQ